MKRLKSSTTPGLPDYSIVRRARVKKRIHLELNENGKLVVVAPLHWSGSQIRTALRQNVTRVVRFVVRARKRYLAPLRYAHGELHLYLGKRYPLVINQAPVNGSQVTLTRDELTVGTNRPGPVGVQACLLAWYRERARMVFDKRLYIITRQAAWTRDLTFKLQVRKMRRTWGNCSSGGMIKLNTHLVKAPLQLIDSVIAHELCHLLEMHHGHAFYTLLEGLNPDWRSHRAGLRVQGASYLLD